MVSQITWAKIKLFSLIMLTYQILKIDYGNNLTKAVSSNCTSKCYRVAWENLLSAGSVDNRFATCAAAASRPSKSSGASSERSPTSNPDLKQIEILG